MFVEKNGVLSAKWRLVILLCFHCCVMILLCFHCFLVYVSTVAGLFGSLARKNGGVPTKTHTDH